MVARITIDEDGARVPQETLIAGLKWIDDWTNVSIMAANPAAQATLKKIPVRTFGDLRRVIEYSLPVDKDHLPERWVLQPGGQEVKSIGNDEANTYSLNVKDLGVHLRLHESPKPNQANRYLVFRITRLLDAGRFWYLEIAAHIPEIRG